jgi:hypothetical protein
MLLIPLLAVASAESDALPYGVPDGTRTFTYEQRDLLTWVNALRVEPTGWDDFLYWASYDSCSSASFSSAEVAPKAPLPHDVSLALEAAGSASSGIGDGVARLSTALYDTGFSTTFNGWACDPGARAIVLGDAYEEAGTAFGGQAYTLVVADADEGSITPSPVVNASHLVDFSRANGNPWYFVAPVELSSGGC